MPGDGWVCRRLQTRVGGVSISRTAGSISDQLVVFRSPCVLTSELRSMYNVERWPLPLENWAILVVEFSLDIRSSSTFAFSVGQDKSCSFPSGSLPLLLSCCRITDISVLSQKSSWGVGTRHLQCKQSIFWTVQMSFFLKIMGLLYWIERPVTLIQYLDVVKNSAGGLLLDKRLQIFRIPSKPKWFLRSSSREIETPPILAP